MPDSPDSPDSPGDSGLLTNTVSLTPQQFARVRAIFEAALARPARDRAGFVDGACGGDEVLRLEVTAMLAADAVGVVELDGAPVTSASSAPEEGRFPAGTVLAGRYRILGRIGQGGMGEVYRAYDLILNQTVALKFLAPPQVGELALARFRNEVRIARQVSHPNVCRVYDLGMVEGLHFLSMEYIDGEDLASLLRRIGRLPQDKAIELARKICAGLSSAHERGILHRDLKPANIMIDGRGQPRITDFGLAALAAEIPLSDLRSGTPAYMSPEQRAGSELTVRSDLYALGLVLHEMFTGKPRAATSSNPTDLVKDLDPAIERVIQRCLEEHPQRRPASALHVAMALPGGDPISAALAAGETPSPEMVAASQEREGFTPRTAVVLFAVVLAMLAAMLAGWVPPHLLAYARVNTAPDGLAVQTRQVLQDLGYPDDDAQADYRLICCEQDALAFLRQQDRDRRSAIAATHQPPIVRFWYRLDARLARPTEGPQTFRTTATDATVVAPTSVAFDNPPNDQPGMVRAVSDATGRLISLEARPLSGDGPATRSPDEAAVFKATQLDPRRFASVPARFVPSMANDARRAWIGSYSDHGRDEVTVEAAWWQGKPVHIQVTHRAVRPAGTAPTETFPFGLLLSVSVAGAVLCVLWLIAWGNLRSGRGDRRGAAKFAALLFVTGLAASVLRGSYSGDLLPAWNVQLARLTFSSLLAWLAYIAIEPLLRRQMPDALISWTRLQAGRVRDPLVASHVLAGIASQIILASLVTAVEWGRSDGLASRDIAALNGMGDFAASLLSVQAPLMFSVILVGLTVLAHTALRRVWLTHLIVAITFGVIAGIGADGQWHVRETVLGTLQLLVPLTLMQRFGYLSLVAAALTRATLLVVPPVLDTWYTGRFVFTLALVTAAAAWCVWVITAAGERARERYA